MAEITTELVLARYPITVALAERIAAYAEQREAGLRPSEARRVLDIGEDTGARYERFMKGLRAHLGLPALPVNGYRGEFNDYRQAALSGTHQTNHVGRGRVDPNCPLCSGGSA